MQYRRLNSALLLILLWALVASSAAQTATYHLHKEASAIVATSDSLLTAGPDGASLAITTPLTSKAAGEYLIKEFETQSGVPGSVGVIPSGSTLTFNLFMRKTANTGTVFPRAKIRLNSATGTLFCTATGTTALTTTVAKRTASCTTTADIAMTATDRFYLWVGVNLTATSATAFNGELDVEGTLNGNFDSTIVLPLATPAPTVTTLTPATGAVGTSVVIAGTNFRAAQGTSRVTFNGVTSTPTVWSDTSITAPVPAGATSGPVVVTVGGQASNGVTFTVTPAPSISSLAPNSGAIGSVVTIAGANFGPAQGTGSVKFNTTVATVTSWSSTSIVATVPTGATTGNVVVTAAGGVASNGVTFTVTAAPAITTVTPAAGGGFGSSFTITGTNFGATQGNGNVTLNTVPAVVTSWSATSIVAQVPAGVTTGNVVVTAAGGISSNGVRFKVLNPGGLAIDQIVFADGTAAATSRATAAFSTTSTNELLLAFISSGRSTNPTTVTTVAGGGLTWALVKRTNTQGGTAEIWRAFATTALTNATVTATFSQSVLSSMTVVTFTGVDTTGAGGAGAIGATATANAATGAPTATLTTTRANSIVVGVGDDPTAKVARTAGANQSIVHQLICAPSAQTCTLWVQQVPTLVPASGTNVTINDTAPTGDAYNLSLVEIKSSVIVVTPAITSLTPASGPIGTSVTIAGSGFGATQGSSSVTFGGVTATPTSWSATSTVVPVPAGVPLGAIPVVVTVPGAGTSNSATFTVVAPLAIAAIVSPLPNANAWNNTNVTVSYQCTGGVPPVVCPGPQTVTTEGANQLVAATATDANNSHATVSVTLNIDKTNPSVTAIVAPAPVNGVVTAPATVTFSCSDALSGTASCPAPVNVTTAGANQVFNGTATDRAGNSASTSLTLNVQLAALAVTATAAPPANAANWNNSDVTITYQCTGGVPPVSCPGARTITTEGAGQLISASATDAGGQTASASVTVQIDRTPPVITGSIAPQPDINGVNAETATVTFTCTDGLSGVATCPSPVTVTTFGPQTINGVVVDNAGNTSTTDVPVNVQHIPTLTVVASVSPQPNAAGWNKSTVTVTYTCSGGLPPIVCPDPEVISADGANIVSSGTATDAYGNTATASATVNLDQTPPLVSITAPPDGSINPSTSLNVTGLESDGLSGVASVTCNGFPAGVVGGNFTCSLVMTQSPTTVTVVVTDVAGNSVTTSIKVTLQGPKVTITSPISMALFSSNSTTVTGTVDDPNAVVSVNGVPAPNQNGSFTANNVVLREGNNLLSATAVSAQGAAGTDSLTVVLDTTPPSISIDSPRDKAILTSPQIAVSGLVNDVVTGTVNAAQVSVTVNGVSASIGNRSFMASNVLLVPGQNVITAVATDRAGNTSQSQVTVTLQNSAAAQQILPVSGNNQTGAVGSVLAAPLVVQLINSIGQPTPGVPVTFTVVKSDGQLVAFPQQGRQITTQADANGQASISFQVGTRVGTGNNQIAVTAPGFVGEVDFSASSTVGPPVQIHDITGGSQKGVIGQPLAEPLVAGVFDVGGNPIAGVPITLKVEKGGGTLEGQTILTKTTDGDGRVSAILVLAQEEGINNNVVSASFDGMTSPPAVFAASGLAPSNGAPTTVSGIVLDNANQPIPNVTASMKGTNLTALTNAQGRFTISNVPVGNGLLFIDGATSTRPETFPFLEFPIVTVVGQDNSLSGPIYLPPLDVDNSKVVGGDEDVVLTMKGVPGVAYTVFAHSATFPDGSKVGRLTLSQVHADKVPMAPPNGTSPAVVGTLQPARVKFNPPIRIQVPNSSGLPSGQVVEVYSFDHDLEQFVSGGTARVSENASVIVSDPGFGLRVSGWHAAPPPPPPPTCADGCNSDNKCKTGACVNGSCQFTNASNGTACDNGGHCGSCKDGTCEAIKIEVKRTDLTHTSSTGTPQPGADPAFTYEPAAAAGASTASYSTDNPNANPNIGNIVHPPNPSATGAPSPGGLATLTVTYHCQAGDTAAKTFRVATFGLSCYVLAAEDDFRRADGTCQNLTIGGRTFTGTTHNPTGLPAGDYCTSFLRDLQLQGSGTASNGTMVHYESGTGPSNWVFTTPANFTGADGTALVPNGTAARSRAIVPRGTSIELESFTVLGNDTGSAIQGYRLDIFGGAGRAACNGFANRMEVGACAPGNGSCPDKSDPQ